VRKNKAVQKAKNIYRKVFAVKEFLNNYKESLRGKMDCFVCRVIASLRSNP